MSKIFLGLFFFYFASGSLHFASSNYVPPGICYICDGSALCGVDNSTLSNCKKGSLCTQEQQDACQNLFPRNENRICDRPGIFPDNASLENFYKCWFAPNSVKFVEERVECPENTIFDSQALLCLTDEERKIAQRLKEYFPVRDWEHPEILCMKPGFYDFPQDCKKYYYCDSKLTSKIFECPFGTYYSRDEKMCTSKLTLFCKGKLNRRANIERLQTLRLLGKIKKMSRKNVPPGLCMKFCEDNWQIVTENLPEVFASNEKDSSNGTFKVSLELLDKYEETALQLNHMIEKISRQEEEEDEERGQNVEETYEEQNYNIQPKPKRLRGFFIRLVIKALWSLIRNVGSFLRQYIRENVCYYIQSTNSLQTTPNLPTTESSTSATTKTNHFRSTDSDTSSKHSDRTTQAIEFHSSTSSPHSDSITRAPKSDLLKKSHPVIKASTFAEVVSSKHSRLTTQAAGSNPASLSQFSDLATQQTVLDLHTPSRNSDPATKTDHLDGTTSSQYSKANGEAIEYDATTSSEYFDFTTQAEDFDSYASDSSTETDANEDNPIASPFCLITQSGSSSPNEKLNSHSLFEAELSGDSNTVKTSVSDLGKQTPDSFGAEEAVDFDDESKHPSIYLHPSESAKAVKFDVPLTKLVKFDVPPTKVVKSDEPSTKAHESDGFISSDSTENLSDSDKSISNQTSKKSFKCPHVGVFRDPDNCHGYYRCIRIPVMNLKKQVRYKIKGKHYTCKNGKYFSPSLWTCVRAKPLECP